ncbi:MAG: hypothetical protein M3128_02940 [Verrucomicrobiota bacterium]|nr:hypothetical protein [Verrucomicrobiota bacterium]
MSQRADSRNELDTMVVNVELTLSSIIQGVALSFLAENAKDVLTAGHAAAWPYVIAGLLIILLFWVRSLVHTLTLMRWPLELGHNCLYIGAALVEVLGFTCLTSPFRWFALAALFAFCVWLIFLYDLKMIRMRLADSSTASSRRLYEEVLRDQQLNIRFVIPAIFVFELSAALLIRTNPDFFLARNGHLLLIASAVLGLLIYLGLIIRSFIHMTPLIAETRADWRSESQTPA